MSNTFNNTVANWERYNDVTASNQSFSDLDISDEEGNAIARFSGGEFQTKNFDSAKTPTQTEDNSTAEFQISDPEGNVIAEFQGGHFRTKKFDSRNINTEGTNLPSYWKTYLDNKKRELLEADLNVGQHGISFFFSTDTHWANNAKQTPAIIKYLKTFTNVKDVICGGDVIVGHGTRDVKLIEMRDWSNSIKDLDCVYIVGNHDYNTSDQPTSESSYLTDANRIKVGEVYRICSSNTEKEITYTHNTDVDMGKFDEYYGYCDNFSQKVRYIFLDSGAVHIPNWSDKNLRISDAQIEWLKAKINELEEGWSVLVFTHIFFQSATGTIHGIGTQITTALDSIYDTCNATIIGVVCGHVHKSTSTISTKGYPIIATTTDAYLEASSESYTRKLGTTTEQAFDIYYINLEDRTIKTIRIGSGDTSENRSFTF